LDQLLEGTMIPFNIPTVTGREQANLEEVFRQRKFSGNGPFTGRCVRWLKEQFRVPGANLTTSCTDALEMSSILAGIEPGDEVILPSFAFTSTANAFLRSGARLVFVDVHPETMNMDERQVAEAVTTRTRVLVALHYAGVPCDMDSLLETARKHDLVVVEDAAQAIFSTYKGRYCGTIGQFGCISFHETKNLHCGEGGAILLNDAAHVARAEILVEKGTNRSRFLRGEVDKYSWVDQGSSFIPSEFNAAFLLPQLEDGQQIIERRLQRWNQYHSRLRPLAESGAIGLPSIPAFAGHNAHIYFIKVKSLDERTALIEHLRERKIHATFHYVPLHSTEFGRSVGRFHGEDRWTTSESERLLRLPLYDALTDHEVDEVVGAVHAFYRFS
jgi:dTDP-4-amino-4,6-dideoxygalactose transaminase